VSSSPDLLLSSIAEAVSDGDAVDWAAAESRASDASARRLVRQLRLVSQIADLHRQTAREEGPERLATWPALPLPSTWAHLSLRQVLGHGAYGTVYRAWDPQLERDVALKLISERDGGPDAAIVAKEGRRMARVRHPGVVTVYGATRADGYVGVWMELIEGRTLEEILQQQGRLSAREAALVGVDVCQALSAVHGAGLLHRDVKAQNVMRDRNGRIVLMDFGTGRERDLPGETSIADLAGTPLYMAPEILRSERASVQSDIYSVGVLLYRLVTGRTPIVARSLAEVREAHAQGRMRRLRDERSDLPGPFVQTVERALSPDPARRFDGAGDLELALTGLLSAASEGGERAESGRPGPWSRWLMSALLILALGTSAVLAWRLASRPSGEIRRSTTPIRFALYPPPATEFESFALSPDGQAVAFTAAGQLWVRELDALEARLISDTQGAHDPFWSPDGRAIAYFRRHSLWIVKVAGGESRLLSPARNAMGGAWGPDGTVLFAADLGEAIYRVATSGGTPAALRVQGTHGYDLRWPSLLPWGKGFIYSARHSEGAPRATMIASWGREPDRVLVTSDANAQVVGGRVLFTRQGELMAQPFDERRAAVTGEPVRVGDRVQSNLYNRADYANFSASADDGRVLALLGPRQVDRELWLLDRTGQGRLLLGPGHFRDMAASPSGRRLAYDQLDPVTGRRDLWVLDLERRETTRVTSAPTDETAPVWTPDERSLIFASNRPDRPGLYRRAADGSGSDELILPDTTGAAPYDVSPDGRLLAFAKAHQRRDSDLWIVPIGRPGEAQTFRASDYRENEPRFSPDGKWLAYSTTDSDDRHVFVERLDSPGPRWQVSVKHGRQPVWRADGKEIFYHGLNRMLMAVSVDLSATPPRIGEPRPLFPLRFRGWDVRYHYAALPDGRGFVLNVPREGTMPPPLTLVLNW
jgi:eukaryotic-like serine/threonine-protein kinase